jgi:Domain of unknown function (DUF1707)
MDGADYYVSDDDRERAVRSLREHLLAGRLTQEEFAERVETAYAARLSDELALTQRGLPNVAIATAAGPHRRPTRFTLAIFSHVIKRGRWRLSRWSIATSIFSDLDLDLRGAELDATHSAVTILIAFGNADVYVPDEIDVRLGGLSIFGRRRDWGHDPARADAPTIRVRVLSLFGTFDVWRVPSDMEGDYGEIIGQIRDRQRQLPS